MANRAWYLTRESFKRQIQVDDSLDDESINRVIESAANVMPRQFFVQTRTLTLTAGNRDHVLMRGMDLLSVISLATDPSGRGTFSHTWSPSEYSLEPSDAPFHTPPHPYWKIRRMTNARYHFPTHPSGVRINSRLGFYDVRRLIPATLVAADDDDEIQRLTPGGTISGGSFTLRSGAYETDPLDWQSTAVEIQAALEGLASIGSGNVAATGGPINTDLVELTFHAALAATNVDQVQIDDMNLTGAGASLVASTYQEGGGGIGVVDASMTTIRVSAPDLVETGHTLHIEDEDLFVSAVDGQELTVERGINGSTAASHNDGMAIEIYTYPLVEQACVILAQRWLRRSKDAPFGVIGSMDGFMRLAINDPDVVGLIGKLVQPAVA